MRLPFKPTALRQKSEPKPEPKEEQDDGLDLFKRSKSFFPKTLAEKEARRKRKQSTRDESGSPIKEDDDAHTSSAHIKRESKPSKSVKAEPRASGASVKLESHASASGSSRAHWSPSTPAADGAAESDDDAFATPPSKRSRTASDTSPVAKRESKKSESPSIGVSKAIPFHTPKKSASIPARNTVITIDDSDDEPLDKDEDDIYGATPVRKLEDSPVAKPAALDDDDLEEVSDPFAEKEEVKEEVEDEFAKYVLAARERQQKAQEAKREAKAPHVEVLVDPEIPGTRVKMFAFTLYKPLSILKHAWCTLQVDRPIPPEEEDSVFLTWGDRRLYNTTTLASLGITTSAERKLKSSPTSWDDQFEDRAKEKTRIFLHAWTEDLWDEAQRRKERARLRELGELGDESDEEVKQEGGAGQEVVELPDEEKIKVIMKTRKGETVKSSARPQTTVGDLIAYFRKARGVPEEAQVLLFFDGEALDEDTTLQEAEIEDMDSIEVHVKE